MSLRLPLLLTVLLLLAGCDSGGDDGPGGSSATISADDIEVVSVTPDETDVAPKYRITLRNETGRTVSINGTLSTVSGSTVLDTGTFSVVDLRNGQQTTVDAYLFDSDSFAGVGCYQYSLDVYTLVAPQAFDSETYDGTCD